MAEVNEQSNRATEEAKDCQQPGAPTMGYHLFLYRQEVARTSRHLVQWRYSKLCLTEALVSKNSVKSIPMNSENLSCLARETIFKNKLKRKLSRFAASIMMKKNLTSECMEDVLSTCKTVVKCSDIKRMKLKQLQQSKKP